MNESATAIKTRGLDKRFGAVHALDSLSLEVRYGEIHAVLGENGAGKSTLLSLLSGLLQPDSGSIAINGHEVARLSPASAARLGVGMVHQHFSLIPAMTALENLMLGAEPGVWRLNARDFEREARERLAAFEIEIPFHEETGRLPAGVRQRIEIARVLLRDARVFLFDEPTAALTTSESDRLLETLSILRERGAAVVFVTHRLDEVMRIADRVTILRQGRAVSRVERRPFDSNQLASAIVGETLPEERFPPLEPSSGYALTLEQAGTRAIESLSLNVQRGEIVGVAGVAGNGQRDWIDLILGLAPFQRGRISILGAEASFAPVFQRREMGLCYIPEDRMSDGLLEGFPLWSNYLLGSGGASWWINRRAASAEARARLDAFAVKAPSVDAPPETLSGGHQQRLLLSRELDGSPGLIVAHNPTRGLDIRAARFVHEALIEACRAGAGVLLFSSELPELFLLCRRIVVIHRGRAVEARLASDWTAASLGNAMTGGAP
ncbi:MAG: ATP-binding cassette domain-containing protein [bacterium]|nr:ATP-binding cassette domain-containing protein [bacterium]